MPAIPGENDRPLLEFRRQGDLFIGSILEREESGRDWRERARKSDH